MVAQEPLHLGARVTHDAHEIAELADRREAGQGVRVEVAGPDLVGHTGRRAGAPLGGEVESRPQQPQRLEVILAPLDDRAEHAEQRQR